MASQVPRASSTFPLDWSEIAVDGAPFHLDSAEAAAPLMPLDATAWRCINDAFIAGIRALGVPIQAYETIYPNHFSYSRMVIDEPSPAQLERIEQAVQGAIAGQMDRWLGEHLPRVVTRVDELKAFDADSPPLAALPDLLDGLEAAQGDLWTIHFRIVFGIGLAMQLFGEFYAELFDVPESDAYALLAGGITESSKAGFAIDDLAERARLLGLDELILRTPDDAVMAALAEAPGGATLLSELDVLLDRYGYRQDLYQMTMPTWLERPSLALAHVRASLRGEGNGRRRQSGVAREADAEVDRARQRLAGYPQPVQDQFETMLQAGREAAFLNEEHNYYIDQYSAALMRLNFLKVGRRLAREGLLDAPEDVLLLESGDLRSLVVDAASGRATGWARGLVRERRGEMEIAATMTPPPFLGDERRMQEPPESLFSRAMRSHFGGPPVPSERPGELRGAPASRGIVTGRARIARSLQEAQSLLPGEILIAPTTMPPWTPLFRIAAAVVTESGGPLSHCAIAARETGIPAVVGVHGATRVIPNGAEVTVDGAAGTVVFGT